MDFMKEIVRGINSKGGKTPLGSEGQEHMCEIERDSQGNRACWVEKGGGRERERETCLPSVESPRHCSSSLPLCYVFHARDNASASTADRPTDRQTISERNVRSCK